MMRAILWATIVMMLGCGSASGTSGAGGDGGSGGATTTTAGSTSTTGDTTTSTGTDAPCVEPAPAGYPDALTGWEGPLAFNNAMTVAPDESAKDKGSAGTAIKFGPFACPHDFAGVGVVYYVGNIADYSFAMPVIARVAVLYGGDPLPSKPPFAPGDNTTLRGGCPTTSGTKGACENIVSDVTVTAVPVAFHVEPGDVVWAAVELLDGHVATAVTSDVAPDFARAAYYAPPGSKANSIAPWALLAMPPAGIPSYPYAPAIKLLE